MLRLDRIDGSNGFIKNEKRENNRKVKRRFYHVRDENKNHFNYINMNSKGFCNVKGEKYNGMLSRYHLHFDPQLSVNKAALRRIPCACESCTKQLSLPWVVNVDASKQPRFLHNNMCKYNNIFGKFNDWIIISVQKKRL